MDPESDKDPEFSPYLCFGGNPIFNKDPDGDFWHIVAGAGIGAIIGGAIETGSQLYKEGTITSWSAIGGAAVQGAITDGVAAATGGASLAVSTTAKVAIVGASAIAANVAGGTANRYIQGKTTTLKDVPIAAGATQSVATGAAVG